MSNQKSSPRTGQDARAEVNTGRARRLDDSATLAAEAAVLGSMVLSSDARNGAAGMLDPEDFSRDAHRTLFATIVGMVGPVDQITVNDQLAATGKLDEVGGLDAVFELTDPLACPSPSAWSAYAAAVRRESRRRRGIRTLEQALERLRSGEDPATVAAELAVAS